MKKLIAMLAIALLHTLPSHAAEKVGQCVFPKTKPAANGNLQFKNPVYIFSGPNSADSKQQLNKMTSFTIKAEKNGYVQLMNASEEKIVGWAKFSDFEFQDSRNCNF